jgi:hypothetical protein
MAGKSVASEIGMAESAERESAKTHLLTVDAVHGLGIIKFLIVSGEGK